MKTFVEAAEKSAHSGVVTMADIRQSLSIDILAREQQISAPAHVKDGLHKFRYLTFTQWIFVLNVSWTRAGSGRKQRDNPGVGKHNGLVEELFAIEEFRIRPVPVSPDHSSEGPLPFRNDKVRRDTATLGTRVGDIVNRDAAAMLNAGFLHVERRFGIVVKSVR